jgi:hypothetical protein
MLCSRMNGRLARESRVGRHRLLSKGLAEAFISPKGYRSLVFV